MAKFEKKGKSRRLSPKEAALVSVLQPPMRIMPAAPGTCVQCAARHDPLHAHNQQSLYYQMRFQQAHGRWPTWADACAHLIGELREAWRRTMESVPGATWSEPPEGVAPIAEPFGISDGRGGVVPDGPTMVSGLSTEAQ